MKGYETIKNPTHNDLIEAIAQCARESFLLSNREAVLDDVGAAALLHPVLNRIDEAAAIKHAKHRRLPADSFSSRLLADGSTNDRAEEVREAQKRRDKKALYVIDRYTAAEWERLGYSRSRDYPFKRMVDMSNRFMSAHIYLRDEIAIEAVTADTEAEQDTKHPKRGSPTINLLRWLSAFWLVSNPEAYKGLLDEWRGNIGNEIPLEPLEEGHPEIRDDYFKILHLFFRFHFENRENIEEDPSFYFEPNFDTLARQNTPEEIFSPILPAELYERYCPNG